MIEKTTILITSLGRTGTEFFARFFAEILPDSTSIHEPDIFQNTGVGNKWLHYVHQVRRAGIWRMVFLKALGKWTLVKLSDERFLGKFSREQAVRELNAQRLGFIQKMPGSVYVEANIGYYGLLDVTPHVFRQHKIIYVVRDGRDWIKSHMNWGEFYGKKGVRKLISHNWPEASSLPNDPYADKWHMLSKFEKLCWAWTRLNEYALKSIKHNPHARIFRFEDIFLGNARYQVLNKLVAFATSQPDIDLDQIGSTEGWLERKVHQSEEGFPSWDDWTQEQKYQFERICGPLMGKLGYQTNDQPKSFLESK